MGQSGSKWNSPFQKETVPFIMEQSRSNCDFPVQNGTVPFKRGRVPLKMGLFHSNWDSPVQNGTYGHIMYICKMMVMDLDLTSSRVPLLDNLLITNLLTAKKTRSR
ncbi:hypothetical protein AVEN_58154-1 [Araneus ventricosus]|uniref:Uncharacterized protein n=1 Tax=Araneus ventricosus TaxID=182803 RepID=A0A4Y2T6J5_ARAVE|nr:hypothetical protein AVEN_58154-1 [Araneus ventricosus]